MPDTPEQATRPITDPDRMLPPHQKSFGAVFGIILIITLLIFGAFYLWGERLNKMNDAQTKIYLTSGTTTLPDITR